MRASKAPSPVVRAKVWAEFEKANPRGGEEYKAWCETTAELLNVSVDQVKRVVASESDALNAQIRRATLTEAQKVANLLGATVTAALEVLGEALEAGKRKPLLDKSGKPQFDPETGQLIYLEEPDWQARIMAANKLIHVHGAYAPQQYEVKTDVTHSFAALTEAELEQQFKELLPTLHEFNIVAPPKPRRSARQSNGTGAAHEGSQVIDGLLLLSDGMHEDEGRTSDTERTGGVQGVSEESVHQGDDRPDRTREDAADQEIADDDGVLDGIGMGGAQGVHETGDKSRLPV